MGGGTYVVLGGLGLGLGLVSCREDAEAEAGGGGSASKDSSEMDGVGTVMIRRFLGALTSSMMSTSPKRPAA